MNELLIPSENEYERNTPLQTLITVGREFIRDENTFENTNVRYDYCVVAINVNF